MIQNILLILLITLIATTRELLDANVLNPHQALLLISVAAIVFSLIHSLAALHKPHGK